MARNHSHVLISESESRASMSVPRPAGMSRTMGVDCTTEGSEAAREVERLGCADTARLAVAVVADACSELRIEIGVHANMTGQRTQHLLALGLFDLT
jgi:hypothetical protein